MRTTRLAVLGLSLGLLHCAPAPKASPGPAPEPIDSGGDSWREPLKTDSGTLVPIARIEGYGNPATGELWIREVRETPEGEPRQDGVQSSAQALSRGAGYCELAVDNDTNPTLGANPNDTFEFYTIGNVAGAAMSDLSSFAPATCQTKLEADLAGDSFYSSVLFPTAGSGCAYQRVRNFYSKRFEHVYMDIDVWNGNYSTNGPYGPGFTNGTITTRPGRRAPSEALGLWDFGPVEPRGTLGDTVNMWIFFKNVPGGGDFNFSGHLVGELVEDCSNLIDDDCDGVANNNCGSVAAGAGCYSDQDCQPGLRCAGAVIRSRFGAANEGADTAGSCVPAPFIGGHIANAGQHGCAILPPLHTEAGRVRCWGTNTSSQLGLSANAPTAQTAPSLQPGSLDAIHLAAGPLHNCAVYADGTVRCWGDNSQYQTRGTSGSPVLANVTAPIPLDVGAPAVQVATGEGHTCVLRDDGGVRCWGGNSDGQVGAGLGSSVLSLHSSDDVKFHVPPAPKKQAMQICAGSKHSCALLDDGKVWCWGHGAFGQLGQASTSDIGLETEVGVGDPVKVLSTNETDSGEFVKGIACGGDQTCAITSSGSLRCWGKGVQGALGYGGNVNVGDNELPNSVPFIGVGGAVKQVSMGDEVTCALLTSGQVKCWGWTGRHGGCLGYPGGCGASIAAPPTNAIDLGVGLSAVEISTRDGVMCAVLSDGGVKCWGGNAQSQSGYGDTANPISPPRAGFVISSAGNNAGNPCQGTVDCTPGNACYQAVCVHDGRLRFSMSWTPDSDFDLHVLTPDATHIYYSNPIAGGGELDVDDCAGSCANPGGTHLENTYFSGTPQQGTYTFYARAFSGGGSYTIRAFIDGTVVASYSGTLSGTGQESTHFTLGYPLICGDGYLSAGEACDTDDAVFNSVDGLTGSCTTYDHTAVTGDDRGGIAIGQTRIVYTGDSATASFNVDNLSSSSTWSTLYDALTSDLATGQLWAFGNGTTPLSFGAGAGNIPTGGTPITLTKMFPVDELTGLPGTGLPLSQPISFRAGESGIFAGPTFILLYGTPDNGATRHFYAVTPATGQVEDLGVTSLLPSAMFGCENWAVWGVAEIVSDKPHVLYVKSGSPGTQIVRTRINDGVTAVVANFGDLGHNCAITVQASTNRWFFHQEHNSVIASPGAGNELIAACTANLRTGSPGQTGCSSSCDVRFGFSCGGVPSICACTVSGDQDNDHDGDCEASCANADLTCFGTDICDDSSGTASCVSSFPISSPASMVLGQPSMLTSGQATSATGMWNPEAVAIDPVTFKVFVADSSNNRVLRFANVDSLTTGAAAERVFGQTSFISNGSGSGVAQLNDPGGLAVDTAGHLWVADRGNARVLRFDNASANGAHGPSANGILGGGGGPASDIDTPQGVAVDGARLWVSDASANRVLRFDNAAAKADYANADGVLGQATFTTSDFGTAASAMNNPGGMDVEEDGTLWVADTNNNRVLRFANAALKADGAAADSVLGQSAFDMSGAATTQSGMDHPQTVSVTDAGWVYVPEANNNRILAFHPEAARTNGAAANFLLGSIDFETAGTVSVSPSTFSGLAQAAYDEHSKTLFLADSSANRVLRFGTYIYLDPSADLVLGQPNFSSNASGSGTATGMASPLGVAVDPTTGKVFVSDHYNSRVLRFASREALLNGAAAEGVLGQSTLTGTGDATAINRMRRPVGIFVDPAGRLWVADGDNRRVLRFDNAATKANGANADAVLGHANFDSQGNDVCTQSAMAHPSSVFADNGGRLWVADDACGRVLRFDNAPMLGNGSNASGVLGQPTFTETVFTARAVTQNKLWFPEQIWVDASARLWVADLYRVLRFDNAASLSNGANASGVLGQPDFVSMLKPSPPSRESSHDPWGVTVSGSGQVFVSNAGHQRIMVFEPEAALMSGAEANGVIGQPDLISAQDWPTSATSVYYPGSLFYDNAANRLWLADAGANRVLAYEP